MNDGEYEYAKLLKNLENEVLAIKTAHQRPLGALNFFIETIQFDVSLTYSYGSYYRQFKVVVKNALPIAKPPIMQPMIDTPAGFYFTSIDDSVVDSNYTTWTYTLSLVSMSISSATIKFGVISSQPIDSITWSYV